ncbi:MAG: UMP kinase [Nitrososphaerota archaeon]
MNIVLKLGGHILFGGKTNTSLIRQYRDMVNDIFDGTGRWVVVVGGGVTAREYVNAGRELGMDEATCDMLAIKVTRLNASLIAHALGDTAVQSTPTSLEEIIALTGFGKIVVTGGLQPGQSTMAVSAVVASAIRAERVVVATDVDGVYTADPKISRDARLIPHLTFEELARIVENTSQRAGEYPLMDQVGLSLLRRTKIPLYYVNGLNVDRVREALLGRSAGTVVRG